MPLWYATIWGMTVPSGRLADEDEAMWAMDGGEAVGDGEREREREREKGREN